MKWDAVIGLGVAGNFTGHLEQAGEASDFAHVTTKDVKAPKGVFPFYVPHPSRPGEPPHFLHQMPISANTIQLNNDHENHQIEPEMAILCDLTYSGPMVTDIKPRYALAHNDCSIRRQGAQKISEKKNWGADSKGTSNQRVLIDTFAPGGILDRYRLACYLIRGEEVHAYGIDSPVNGYSYFYQQLLDWLMEKLNTQTDHGPLEDLAHWLKIAEYPKQALISVGATKYTTFGATNYLQRGDRSIVVLYDGEKHRGDSIISYIETGKSSKLDGVSILDQSVV